MTDVDGRYQSVFITPYSTLFSSIIKRTASPKTPLVDAKIHNVPEEKSRPAGKKGGWGTCYPCRSPKRPLFAGLTFSLSRQVIHNHHLGSWHPRAPKVNADDIGEGPLFA
ncbi:hypothetical protein K456DRAFT_1177775 [Colletotrichum gloeosporioides 23]|nr:hypothetical protein K456DRAFT_1177775 [Colletotrichum gloeosporioides 23]